MYATPVIYPLSLVPIQYRIFYSLNPMAAVIELFRKAFLGTGSVSVLYTGMSVVITLLVLFSGIIVFNRVEKNFMDTV